MPKQRSARRQKALDDSVGQWTYNDERLSGMKDPLEDASGIPPDALRLFEQSFYTAIMNDREYWAERNARIESEVNPIKPQPGRESFWTRPANGPDSIDVAVARVELAAILVPQIIVATIERLLRRVV